ncbi:MAG: hypothetical protein WBA93_36755 [Microcoleaceae cyanobacterium]
MGRPYSLIQKADELKVAKDNFDNWNKLGRAEKRALYQTKKGLTGNLRSARESGILYIVPFGVKQSDSIWILGSTAVAGTAVANVSESSAALITALAGLIVGATKWGQTAVPTGVNTIIIESTKKSELAQVKLVETGEIVGAAGESRITKLPYTYRKKDSVSSRFGQKIDGAEQSFEVARQSIRAAGSSLSADQKLYFKNQKEIKLTVVNA